MKHFLKSVCGIFLLVSNLIFAQNQVTLSADLGKHTINRHIYGHFAEHLGKCIYGGFYVGENNTKIPNKNGVRMDVVEALKKMKIPNLRWPGGMAHKPERQRAFS